MRKFDMETIKTKTRFENITKSEVRDCIKTDKVIYFIINKGKMAYAIGKGGKTIKNAEKIMKKQIKVFEYSEDEKQFVKNLIPQASKIETRGKKVIVTITKEKGKVIGKNGSNIKILKQILERNSKLKELEIR